MKYILDNEKIFKLIQSTGKTLDNLAGKCDISMSTLAQIRSGENKTVTIDTLVKFCDCFKITDVREVLKEVKAER